MTMHKYNCIDSLRAAGSSTPQPYEQFYTQGIAVYR